MKKEDLLISSELGIYRIKVTGRANFEYAVPLRHLSKCLDTSVQKIWFDVSACTAMDSTFMGVLSMLGLQARKQNATVEICGAPANVRALLKGLGVDKLFVFTEQQPEAAATAYQTLDNGGKSMLDTAETVVDAHQTLVEADSGNAEKFDKVIEFAQSDLERLKQEGAK